MGSCSSVNSKVFDTQYLRPKWTFAVQVRSEFLHDKISSVSSGFRLINNSTAELSGTGNKFDGARWSRGFISGKHVIEFIFPVHLRGSYARVGLGTSGTRLGGNNVGESLGGKQTWAIDLVQKKAFSNGKTVGTFPAFGVSLPDWFFMYIDLDEGTLQFGSDTTYYGTAFEHVTIQDGPLYPIVTAAVNGAIVGMVYRGEGKHIDGPLRKRRSLAIRQSSQKHGPNMKNPGSLEV